METPRVGIPEALSARWYLGSGVVGLVPFEVIATKPLNKEELSSLFKVIEDSHPSSKFLASSEDHKKPGDNGVLFILKDDLEQPQIEVVSPDLFVIKGLIDSVPFQDRLPYLFYNLAERARQEKFGLLTAHAAAVSKDGKGILILGDKGSGKTSLMLALCLTQGYKMIGNDSVILGTGELSIVSGNRQIIVRRPVAERLSLPLKGEPRTDQIGYEAKLSFLPEELGIETCDSVPVYRIVRVNIHPGNLLPFAVARPFSFETEALRMWENLSRRIRGVTTPLQLSSAGVGGFFPSLDTPELGEIRNKVVNTLLRQILYVSGRDPIHTAQQLDVIISET